MCLDGEEYELLWEAISKAQIIFHPRYSQDGKLDYSELITASIEKQVIIFLDRNLLSSLLHLSQEGSLKDEKEMRIIALLMTWALLNNFPVSAGLGIKEQANKSGDFINAKVELDKFQKIFSFYPRMTWLRLAEGIIDSLPPFCMKVEAHNTVVDYCEQDDHFLMHISEMIHVVYLLKQNMSSIDRVLNYLRWNYANLIVCESTLTYIIMLFTNQENIKAPKGAGSNDIVKIIEGCRNQAWDLNYLSNWSCFHYNEKEIKDLFLFATNDNMLKMIFINTYSDSGFVGLVEYIFCKKDAKIISDLIEANTGPNRKKPDFGSEPRRYFDKLIETEKEQLSDIIKYKN